MRHDAGLAVAEVADEPVASAEEKHHGDGLGSSFFWWRRRRFQIAFLSFVGFANLYAVRVNLSVAIVDMVAVHSLTSDNGTTTYYQNFTWDSQVQGLLLSMFFYGYAATQILGGWLSIRFGGARLMGIGIAGSVALSLVTPPLAATDVYLLMAARVLMGCFQGLVMPAMNDLWVRWAPIDERTRMGTITLSGCTTGTVIALPLSGIIASQIGWPYIFYIFGGSGLLWYCLWLYYVRNSPEQDSSIMLQELNYITASKDSSIQNIKAVSIPWCGILTSPPFISAVTAHFAANYGLYMFVADMPLFMNDTLNFDLQKTGFLSAVPYLAMAILLQISGHISDMLIKKKIFCLTQLRKLFLCGAFFLQACALILASYLKMASAIVVCLTVALAIGAFAYASLCVIFMDMSPLHSSVLAGISSTVANFAGIIGPVIAGYIVKHKSAEEWRIVFFITSGIYVSAAIIFGLFGSAEKQAWACETEDKENSDSIKCKEDEFSSIEMVSKL